jgi:hypothetical protein
VRALWRLLFRAGIVMAMMAALSLIWWDGDKLISQQRESMLWNFSFVNKKWETPVLIKSLYKSSLVVTGNKSEFIVYASDESREKSQPIICWSSVSFGPPFIELLDGGDGDGKIPWITSRAAREQRISQIAWCLKPVPLRIAQIFLGRSGICAPEKGKFCQHFNVYGGRLPGIFDAEIDHDPSVSSSIPREIASDTRLDRNPRSLISAHGFELCIHCLPLTISKYGVDDGSGGGEEDEWLSSGADNLRFERVEYVKYDLNGKISNNVRSRYDIWLGAFICFFGLVAIGKAFQLIDVEEGYYPVLGSAIFCIGVFMLWYGALYIL